MDDGLKFNLPKNLPTHMMIGGEPVFAEDGATLSTMDPATGEVIVNVPAGGTNEVNRAVENSKIALEGAWRSITPAERGRMLNRVAAIIRREAQNLAVVETLDSGKPLRESHGDIETAAAYFEYYAGIADKMQGDTIPLGSDYISLTLHEPVGVTAHIIPWNFPLVTTARGVAPALAAGNTAVVKPATQTPLTAIILADLIAEAGIPAGAYNVVTGRGDMVGDTLTGHPEISHITFTGSVDTGKHVMRTAADHVASVTLELGGKSPVVVLKDADITAAVEGTLKAIYLNAGQVCSAGSRLVVEQSVHSEMMEKLVAETEALTLGHGLDDPPLGPVVSPEQRDLIAKYVDAARTRGIEVATGGASADVDGFESIDKGPAVC